VFSVAEVLEFKDNKAGSGDNKVNKVEELQSLVHGRVWTSSGTSMVNLLYYE
jgi:hypothetical protein